MQDRAIESRAKIVNGAKKLLKDSGVADFSMRKLALASGVGLGTIYDYFPSWTDIVRVLLEERFELRSSILDATLNEVSREDGLGVFVPAYLQRLADQGFWHSYDHHLRDAADADPELRSLFERQELQIAKRYVAEMRNAGSSWTEAELLQMTQMNMAVSQLIATKGEDGSNPRQLQIELVANMLRANLKMALRKRSSSRSKHKE